MSVVVLNVYYLLCYAWEMWEEGQLVDVSGESFHFLSQLFVRVLNSGVAHLIKRGLDRNYLREEDELLAPRGKFDLSVTVKRMLMLRSRIQCVYDTFSHDIAYNQIIKATLKLAAQCKQLDEKLRAESAALYRRLREVTYIDLSAADFGRLPVHRNRFYSFLIHVCRIVYDSLLIDQKRGDSVFRDFLRNENAMARLFERFVRRFYQRELNRREPNEYHVTATKMDWVEVSADPDDDVKFLPEMKTDVTIRSRTRTVVIDTKYYRECLQISQYGKATVHSDNLYQMFAYLKNFQKREPDGPTVEGILLYPVVGEPRDLHFRIHGHPLVVATLNLDQHWKGIERRLLQLINNPVKASLI